MEKIKITKTIRFKANPINTENQNDFIQEKINIITNVEFDLRSFVSELNNFKDDLKTYLFYERESKKNVKKGLSIKNEWLKQYAKQLFHDSEATRDKTKRKSTKTIGDFDGLAYEIELRFNELEMVYKLLADNAIATLNERAKKAQTGLLLKRVAARNALPYFASLVENTINKDETDDLSIRLNNQGKKLKEKLLAGIQAFLPEQSNGLPVAKASFNYYTINKTPVDFEQKKQEQQNKLKINDNNWNELLGTLSREIKDEIKKDVTDLAELRQKLKNIKAQQKKEFNELMSKTNFTYEELKSTTLYLFNNISKDDFNEYHGLTKQIEEKAIELNQATSETHEKQLRSDLQLLKKKRGAFINAADNNNKNKFKSYKDFATLYRNVALKHGRILSTLKAIEKENTESQLLNYWALIMETKGKHQLVLIPKEKTKTCYEWIKNADRTTENNNKIYWFESFTLRSLRKLCFDHLDTGNNTFNQNMTDVLQKHSYFDNGKEIAIQGEFSFKGNEHKIICFYKDVLESNYAKKNLNLPNQQIQDEIISQNFETLDDFQIALEKICYKRYAIAPSDVNLSWKYKAQLFDITSYDLEIEQKGENTLKIEKNSFKPHTQIWKEFWSDKNEQENFDIRINPEITLMWRCAKESRVNKYGKGSNLYDPKKKNRYLQPQFTLMTTISEHSNTPTKVLSFMTDDEFAKSVEDFNKKLKKEDVKFALGIDNGETELATLGVFFPKFIQDSYEKSIVEIKKVSEYGFKVLTITNLLYSEIDRNGKERKIIQNPSYFLNKEQYTHTFNKTDEEHKVMVSNRFKEETLLTLDLTTVKVINGHIVSNGDVPTFFNLWLRHAQRNIWDMNDHSQKETAKKITLKNNDELTVKEKVKFVEYLNNNNKKYDELSQKERERYTEWIYSTWDGTNFKIEETEERKFKEVKKNQRVGSFSKFILFAVCYIGSELETVNVVFDVRNVFKFRKDFYGLKSKQQIRQELESYNSSESLQQISNEELDLKINHLRQALVANAVGVIDLLYKKYKEKTGGEGLIVKEGFDTGKVAQDLEKFSGNIYRIFERKLYQKFQNYGLVPPIKSLMAVRNEGLTGKKDVIVRLGNVGFIDPAGTSQNCPVCETKFGHHQNEFDCKKCTFSPKGIMHSNDGIAGYNIAKRGIANFDNPFKKAQQQEGKSKKENKPQKGNYQQGNQNYQNEHTRGNTLADFARFTSLKNKK